MTMITKIAIATAVIGAFSGCAKQETDHHTTPTNTPSAYFQAAPTDQTHKAKFEVPASIAAEHKELHEQLENAINSGAKTGDAAKKVEELLKVHFEKEEEFALPQLGLLAELSEGRVFNDMKKATDLSDKLKADLPKMLEEHKGIVEALDALAAAAREESKAEVIEFTKRLKAHAQNEEQVMYPAAILVGEYIKLKLKK